MAIGICCSQSANQAVETHDSFLLRTPPVGVGERCLTTECRDHDLIVAWNKDGDGSGIKGPWWVRLKINYYVKEGIGKTHTQSHSNIYIERERDRERDRERERETDRQTDRQRDRKKSNLIFLYIRGVFNRFPDVFVQAFKIVGDSWKYSMLLCYGLTDQCLCFQVQINSYNRNWNTPY